MTSIITFYNKNKNLISNIINIFFIILNVIHCLIILYLIKQFEQDECAKQLIEDNKPLVNTVIVMSYYMIVMFCIIFLIIISGVKLNAKTSKIFLIINIINYIFVAVFIGIVVKFVKIIKFSDCLLTGKIAKYFKSTAKWIYILILILVITVVEFIYKYYKS